MRNPELRFDRIAMQGYSANPASVHLASYENLKQNCLAWANRFIECLKCSLVFC